MPRWSHGLPAGLPRRGRGSKKRQKSPKKQGLSPPTSHVHTHANCAHSGYSGYSLRSDVFLQTWAGPSLLQVRSKCAPVSFNALMASRTTLAAVPAGSPARSRTSGSVVRMYGLQRSSSARVEGTVLSPRFCIAWAHGDKFREHTPQYRVGGWWSVP